MKNTKIFFTQIQQRISNLKKSVLFIGGFNADIQTTPSHRAVPGDSVPGHITMTAGGVARNIAENCSRLGLDCSLFSLYGEDSSGAAILRETALSGVNTDLCLCMKGEKTCTYSAFIDESGEMLYGVNEMYLMERMTPVLMESVQDQLNGFDFFVIDANLPQLTLQYLHEKYSSKILLIDPVSASKIKRIKGCLGSVGVLKPNIIEAEEFTGVRIQNEEDYYRVMTSFLDAGVNQVFLSAGPQGMYYSDGIVSGLLQAVTLKTKSVTGAGDAASAALVLSVILNLGMLESAFLANLAASSSLLCSQSINRDLSLPYLLNLCKEYQYESSLS